MGNARTRVLFVHHRSELGGSPESLCYLIKSLDHSRFASHVYCPPGPAADAFAQAGATVHTGQVATFTHIWASSYQGRRWLLFGRELLRLPRHARTLARTIRSEHIDVVHLNDSPLVPAAIVARRLGVPVVWHLRASLPGTGDGWVSALVRWSVRQLGTLSIAISGDIGDVFAVGSTVIHNAVDLERFHPGQPGQARRALGLAEETPVVAMVGFIYPFKGYREFIRAAKLLTDRGVEAQFLIVGGGVRRPSFFQTFWGRALVLLGGPKDYESDALRLVRELDMNDVFRCLPFQEQIETIYHAADLVVAPSRGQELSRPLIEAAASGIPAITSGSATGAGIVLPGQTGLLVEDQSVERLAARIEELLLDPARRASMGAAARQHAELSFDIHQQARQIEAMYDEVLAAAERVRILFVHHRSQLGGAPSSLALLIGELDPRFDVHIFVPAGPASDLFASMGATVHNGPVAIFAHAWDSPYKGFRWVILLREVVAFFPHIRQFRATLRKHRFAIVHLNDSPLLLSACLAHRAGSRVVWHLRSALAGEGRDRRSRMVLSLMQRWGDAAIAIDSDVAARFHLKLPITIVHNAVRMPADDRALTREEARRRLELPDERVTIGFAGFLRQRKGWPQYLDAAEILVREGLPVHFVVMGGGIRPSEYFTTFRGRLLERLGLLTDDEGAMRARVSAAGLDDHFSFLPFTRQTGDVYQALDIFTFPNQGVGLGRPVIEAARYGVPVVASGSRNGGDGVLLPEVTGLLVAEPTGPNLAAALRRIVVDPELRRRLGETAREHARKAFDPAQAARAVEAVYDALPAPAGRDARSGRRH